MNYEHNGLWRAPGAERPPIRVRAQPRWANGESHIQRVQWQIAVLPELDRSLVGRRQGPRIVSPGPRQALPAGSRYCPVRVVSPWRILSCLRWCTIGYPLARCTGVHSRSIRSIEFSDVDLAAHLSGQWAQWSMPKYRRLHGPSYVWTRLLPLLCLSTTVG